MIAFEGSYSIILASEAHEIMSVTRSQVLSAKRELEASLIGAKELKSKLFNQSGQLDLNKKDSNYNLRAFKNRLLAAKWDCEDLEELLSTNSNVLGQIESTELRIYVDASRKEIANMTNHLDDAESRFKTLQKHGFQDEQPDFKVAAANPDDQHPFSPISDKSITNLVSDKNRSTVSANVFSNALYDHLENGSRLGFETSKIFNNLERPTTDVYVSPNENESILEMLETGYSNRSSNARSYDKALRRMFDTTGGKFVGLIVCIIIIFFMI